MAGCVRLDEGQISAGDFVFPVMRAVQFNLIGTADVRAVTSTSYRCPPGILHFFGGGKMMD